MIIISCWACRVVKLDTPTGLRRFAIFQTTILFILNIINILYWGKVSGTITVIVTYTIYAIYPILLAKVSNMLEKPHLYYSGKNKILFSVTLLVIFTIIAVQVWWLLVIEATFSIAKWITLTVYILLNFPIYKCVLFGKGLSGANRDLLKASLPFCITTLSLGILMKILVNFTAEPQHLPLTSSVNWYPINPEYWEIEITVLNDELGAVRDYFTKYKDQTLRSVWDETKPITSKENLYFLLEKGLICPVLTYLPILIFLTTVPFIKLTAPSTLMLIIVPYLNKCTGSY